MKAPTVYPDLCAAGLAPPRGGVTVQGGMQTGRFTAVNRPEVSGRPATTLHGAERLVNVQRDMRTRAGTDRAKIAALRDELVGVRVEARADREQIHADCAAEPSRAQAAAETRATSLERALATAGQTITRLQARRPLLVVPAATAAPCITCPNGVRR